MKFPLICALATAFTFALALSLAIFLVPANVRQTWRVHLTSAGLDENSTEYIDELEAEIENLNSLIAHRDADLSEQEKKINALVGQLQQEREEEFEGRDEDDDEDDVLPNSTGAASATGAAAASAVEPAQPNEPPAVVAAAKEAPLIPVAVAAALDKAEAAQAAIGTVAEAPPLATPASSPSLRPQSQPNANQAQPTHHTRNFTNRKAPWGVKTIYVNSPKYDPANHLQDHFVPQCPSKCIIRADKQYFQEAHAVVWETLRLTSGSIKKPDVKHKKPEQKWLFRFFFEAPYYGGHKVKPAIFDKIAPGIDYTMTFKGGSDFFQPFFWTVPVGQDRDDDPLHQDEVNGRDWAKGRSMLLMGIISNCIGPRMKFWKALTALLPKGRVKLFGHCGEKPPCTARSDRDPCWVEVFQKYKFYFSAENNRCDGYITEKFSRPLRSGMVPLALGGKSRRDYERIAPGDAFIHPEDFASLEALANHLKRVDQDDNLYRPYFNWRKKFQLESRQGRRDDWQLMSSAKVYCTLCEQLYKSSKEMMPTHTYGKSLDKWFYKDVCIPYEVNWNKAGQLPPPPSEPRCQPGGPCA